MPLKGLIALLLSCTTQSKKTEPATTIAPQRSVDGCVPAGLEPIYNNHESAKKKIAIRPSMQAVLAMELRNGNFNESQRNIVEFICEKEGIELPKTMRLNELFPQTNEDVAFAGCMCLQLRNKQSIFGPHHPFVTHGINQSVSGCVRPGLIPIRPRDSHAVNSTAASFEAAIAFDLRTSGLHESHRKNVKTLCDFEGIELPNQKLKELFPPLSDEITFAGCMCFQKNSGESVFGPFHPNAKQNP